MRGKCNRRRGWCPIPAGLLVVALAAVLFAGCASQPAPQEQGIDAAADGDVVELFCGLALMRLEQLIETRSSNTGFSPAVLAEAKELHRMGKQLYLQREYGLALELSEEGISLLEGDGG